MKFESFSKDQNDSIWTNYKWQRVRTLVPAQADTFAASATAASARSLGRPELIQLLRRRGARSFSNESIESTCLDNIARTASKQFNTFPWMSARFYLKGVEDKATGLYALENGQLSLITTEMNFGQTIRPLIQNQWWVRSNGIHFFLVADWAEAMQAYPTRNGYHYVWLALGQVGELILEEATLAGLKSRMTPAVSESLANKNLGLNAKQDLVYYFRFGKGQ